ncbi:MAG: putative molybdenum carrier protein [bacterium]
MKIISGGQSGADRAALDAAIDLKFEYGGSIPQGRLTEAGALDPKYDRMTELSTSSYPVRTEKNVIDADATLVFNMGTLEGGTTLTVDFAKKCNTPYLIIDLKATTEPEAIRLIKEWLDVIQPQILNVAGPRESKARGIYNKVYGILMRVFGHTSLEMT